MKEQEFIFWLKGIIEFNDELTKPQVSTIRKQLELVKREQVVTPPMPLPNQTQPNWITEPSPIYCGATGAGDIYDYSSILGGCSSFIGGGCSSITGSNCSFIGGGCSSTMLTSSDISKSIMGGRCSNPPGSYSTIEGNGNNYPPESPSSGSYGSHTTFAGPDVIGHEKELGSRASTVSATYSRTEEKNVSLESIGGPARFMTRTEADKWKEENKEQLKNFYDNAVKRAKEKDPNYKESEFGIIPNA